MSIRCSGLSLCVLLAVLSTPANAALDAILADPQRAEADRQRDGWDHPADVLAFAGVRPGMSLLDLFAGTGYYSQLLGAVVGSNGNVLLHNNAAYLDFAREGLEARMQAGPMDNVTRLDTEAAALGVQPASLDGVFMMLVFHDFWYTSEAWAVTAEQVLPQLYEALEPGGFVLIVDHAGTPGSGTTAAQELHRIDEPAIIRTMEEYGFELDARSELLRNPDDDPTISVFDPAVRGHTDRLVHRYRKPGG